MNLYLINESLYTLCVKCDRYFLVGNCLLLISEEKESLVVGSVSKNVLTLPDNRKFGISCDLQSTDEVLTMQDIAEMKRVATAQSVSSYA